MRRAETATLAGLLFITAGMPLMAGTDTVRIHEGLWAAGLFEELRSAPIVVVARIEQESATERDPEDLGLVAGGMTELQGRLNIEAILHGLDRLDAKWSFPYRSIQLHGGSVVPDGHSYDLEPWNHINPQHGSRVLIIADSLRDDGSLLLHTFESHRAYGFVQIDHSDSERIIEAVRRFLGVGVLPPDWQIKEFARILENAEEPRLLRQLAACAVVDRELGSLWSPLKRAKIVAGFLLNKSDPVAFRRDLLAWSASLVQEKPEIAREVLASFVGLWADELDFDRLRLSALKIISDNLEHFRADPVLMQALMPYLLRSVSSEPKGMNNPDQVMIIDRQGFWVAPLLDIAPLEQLRLEVLEQLRS